MDDAVDLDERDRRAEALIYQLKEIRAAQREDEVLLRRLYWQCIEDNRRKEVEARSRQRLAQVAETQRTIERLKLRYLAIKEDLPEQVRNYNPDAVERERRSAPFIARNAPREEMAAVLNSNDAFVESAAEPREEEPAPCPPSPVNSADSDIYDDGEFPPALIITPNRYQPPSTASPLTDPSKTGKAENKVMDTLKESFLDRLRKKPDDGAEESGAAQEVKTAVEKFLASDEDDDSPNPISAVSDRVKALLDSKDERGATQAKQTASSIDAAKQKFLTAFSDQPIEEKEKPRDRLEGVRNTLLGHLSTLAEPKRNRVKDECSPKVNSLMPNVSSFAEVSPLTECSTTAYPESPRRLSPVPGHDEAGAKSEPIPTVTSSGSSPSDPSLNQTSRPHPTNHRGSLAPAPTISIDASDQPEPDTEANFVAQRSEALLGHDLTPPQSPRSPSRSHTGSPSRSRSASPARSRPTSPTITGGRLVRQASGAVSHFVEGLRGGVAEVGSGSGRLSRESSIRSSNGSDHGDLHRSPSLAHAFGRIVATSLMSPQATPPERHSPEDKDSAENSARVTRSDSGKSGKGGGVVSNFVDALRQHTSPQPQNERKESTPEVGEEDIDESNLPDLPMEGMLLDQAKRKASLYDVVLRLRRDPSFFRAWKQRHVAIVGYKMLMFREKALETDESIEMFCLPDMKGECASKPVHGREFVVLLTSEKLSEPVVLAFTSQDDQMKWIRAMKAAQKFGQVTKLKLAKEAQLRNGLGKVVNAMTHTSTTPQPRARAKSVKVTVPEPPEPSTKAEKDAFYRDLLMQLYSYYEPHKMPSFDKVVAVFKGREKDVITVLLKKYGGMPPSWEERVEDIAEKHCPVRKDELLAQLNNVDKGKEYTVLQPLVSQFGPEYQPPKK